MDTLSFKKTIRKGNNKGTTERHFLDFIILGKSLKTVLGVEDSDLITPFGWINDKKREKQIKNNFRLQGKPELRTERVPIYVCAECGDIGCGAITVSIKCVDNKIIWRDFGFGTGPYEDMEQYAINIIEFDKQEYLQAFSDF